MPGSTCRTRGAFLGAALPILVCPARAEAPLDGLILVFGGIFRLSGVVMLLLLPGAIIGAKLAFAIGKRKRCILGAIAGNVPVIAAFALWGGNWNDRGWDGFFFTLLVFLFPVVAIIVGVPVGYITYSMRSAIKSATDEDGETSG